MIHHVFANKSNVGDWVSAQGIRAAVGTSERREYFCDAPFVSDTLARLVDVPASDLVIIGGGCLLMDYFAPFWDGLLALPHRPAFVVWGVGRCGLKARETDLPHGMLAMIARESRLCCVRDDATREVLGGWAWVVPCPGLVAVPTSGNKERRLLCVEHVDLVEDPARRVIRRLAEEFASATGREFVVTDNIIPAGDEAALAAALQQYATADVVVSTRLHGCVLGVASGCRVLAVSGAQKVDSFMAAMGLADWVCDARDMSGVERKLGVLDTQVLASERLAWARRENMSIGAEMRALVGSKG